MKIILNADKNWAIGCENKLLFPIPEDLAFFKQKTLGKVVVMGKNTLLSLPGGKPLKNRTNIVLTSNPDSLGNKEDLIICRDLGELSETLKRYNRDEIFVIGGEKIYKTLLDKCDEIFVTKVQKEAPEADKFFINLDSDERFVLKEESEEKYYNGITFTFCRYERKRV